MKVTSFKVIAYRDNNFKGVRENIYLEIMILNLLKQLVMIHFLQLSLKNIHQEDVVLVLETQNVVEVLVVVNIVGVGEI